jgi:hypothetical protein
MLVILYYFLAEPTVASLTSNFASGREREHNLVVPANRGTHYPRTLSLRVMSSQSSSNDFPVAMNPGSALAPRGTMRRLSDA